MNPEQSLQILKSVLDLSVARGGIFQSIEQSRSAILAFETLSNFVQSQYQSKEAQKEITNSEVKE